jgi:L-amino acid N-acyltransferase YncA
MIVHVPIDPDETRAARLMVFYTKFGFEEVGRLKKVACKFGHDIDVRVLQKALVHSSAHTEG